MAGYGFNLEVGAVYYGVLYLRPMDAAEPLVDLGNTKLMVTNITTKTTERLSMRKGSAGLPLDSSTKIDKLSGNLTIDTLNRTVLARATMGEDSDFTQSAVTDSTVDVALYEAGYMELGAYHVANVRIAGSVAGTDYEVESDPGLIKLIPGGNLTDGETQTVTYNTGAIDGFQVDAGIVPVSYVQLMLDGVNSFNDVPFVLDIPKATLSPDGDFNWINDQVNEAKFGVQTLLKSGAAAPYRLRVMPRA